MQSKVITTDRENRLNFKNKLLSKVEAALTPPVEESVSEPVIEIVEKYAHGLRPVLEPAEMAPEFKKEEPFILDSDVQKRKEFKDKLLNKVSSLKMTEPVEEELEIISDFSPVRTISVLEPEFPVIHREPLPIVERPAEVVHSAPAETLKIRTLRLPSNYKELDERALYGVLTRTPELQHSSESANITLDILFGRSSEMAQFEVIETPTLSDSDSSAPVLTPTPEIPEQFKVQDEEKRVAFAAKMAKKIKLLDTEPMDVVDEVVPEYKAISVPENWESIPLATLRADLFKLNPDALPEQIHETLGSLLTNEELVLLEQELSSEEVETVEVPEDFSSWKPYHQYLYLTKTLKTTPEKADRIIWNLSH